MKFHSGWKGAAATFAFGAALVAPPAGFGAVPDGVSETGPFAQGDVQAGRRLYEASCASCHGTALQGAAGPVLKGPAFASKWLPPAHPENDLIQALRRMPLSAPDSLSLQQYSNVARYLAEQSAQPAAAPQPQPAEGISFPTAPKQVARASGARPDDAEIAKVAASNWLVFNRDYRGQRFSPLAQINTKNISKLRPVCLFQLGELTSFQNSPVIYDGRMYVSTGRSTYAIDAATCRKLWKTDHPASGPEVLPTNRGLALYRGKIFRGTPDGRLLALDAADGKLLWELRVADSARGSFLSLAPVAADGMVFVGEAGADWGANGHIHAFDVETGARIWTFDIIPTGNQPGAETWGKGSETGGGSVWSSLAYDVATKTVYASTGNPAPDYDGSGRPGDNLYTSSVVVLDGRTGALRWYAQQTPHDTHDWDTVAAPMLYDVGGKLRVAVASKAGWLYIYDRGERRLLSRQAVTTQDNMDAPLGADYVHSCPGQLGGVQWNGPAFDPSRKALFVNAVDWCGAARVTPTEYSPGRLFMGGQYKPDPVAGAFGWVRAFDAVSGKPLWVYRAATPMIAGLTPTAGGVLFTGDLNGDFLGFDSGTGRLLYKFNTGGAVAGGISTYSVGGKQFVAVPSGYSGRTSWPVSGSPTIVVFGLPD